jgi:hypothetical protein
MSANIKASVDGTQAIIGVGGVDQMTVSNAGVVTANSFVGLNSSSVTATGSNAARTLANRFADVMNVKDFGAVGDWNSTTGTDNFTAFQNAIAALSTRGGTVYIPSGRYLCNGTLQLTDGIRIVGDGSINNNGSTQIVFGNTLGPCIRILESHCELKDFNIGATNARRTYVNGRITGANYASLGLTRNDQNYGIWIEPNDVPTGNTQFAQIQNVWIHNQPNDALVIASRSYIHSIKQIGISQNIGHGIVITDGTYTGRTSGTNIPIGINVVDSAITSATGHGILSGTPNEDVPPARIIIENLDCYATGTNTSIMYPDSDAQYYVHFFYADQSVIKNSAVVGRDVLGTILCGGRQIELDNNRYLESIQPIRVEGDLGSGTRETEGVKVFGLSVINPPSTVTNAVSIGSNADNIEVDAAVAGGYTNPATLGLASIVYDIDKTIFNESVLVGKAVDDDNSAGSRIASGIVSSTRSGNVSGIFGRNTSNGDLIFFRQAGSTKGKIAVDSNSAQYYTMTNVFWESGAFGNPNSNITASPGSMYTSTVGGTGATLWVKETGTGNTGWVAK